jgi:hypothetical protein
MIERVARAIYRAKLESASTPGNRELLVDLNWSLCVPEAQAAILAMREPTEAMKRAADRLPDVMSVGDEWRAMIDEALKDTP